MIRTIIIFELEMKEEFYEFQCWVITFYKGVSCKNVY